ncbi:unnamed protein product [Mucor hiemalis]
MESTSPDQRLNRLPTEFFPLPNPDIAERGHHHKPRVVVVAYDHSNYSDAMIAKCIRIGMLRPTDDIRILHIVSQSDYRTLFAPMSSSSATSGGIRSEVLDTSMENAADALIYEIINVLRKRGFEHVSSEVMRGDPKLSITDYCRLSKPVYLLTGTRGLGAVKRSVMGSVSNYLTRHCPCPVLIVKLDPSEIEARKVLNDKKAANFAEVLDSFNKAHPTK